MTALGPGPRPGTRSGPGTPAFNAVVLAGGRSSRLGGTPKSLLRSAGKTLLATTLEAVSGATRTAVAGPPDLAGIVAGFGPRCVLVREDPPFTGPAAAVAAGLAALDAPDAPDPGAGGGRTLPGWTLVLACDMPRVGGAVQALLAEAAAAADRGDQAVSLLAVDDGGRAQPLAGLYLSADLAAAVTTFDRPGGLENLSMKRLLARVQWRAVAVPADSTADVDTWEDAARWCAATGPGDAATPN